MDFLTSPSLLKGSCEENEVRKGAESFSFEQGSRWQPLLLAWEAGGGCASGFCRAPPERSSGHMSRRFHPAWLGTHLESAPGSVSPLPQRSGGQNHKSNFCIFSVGSFPARLTYTSYQNRISLTCQESSTDQGFVGPRRT